MIDFPPGRGGPSGYGNGFLNGYSNVYGHGHGGGQNCCSITGSGTGNSAFGNVRNFNYYYNSVDHHYPYELIFYKK